MAFFFSNRGKNILLVWSFYSIPLRMQLSGYFFPAKWSGHCIPAGMGWSIHACRNGVVIPFPQEWNGVIPFLLEWNGVIPFLQEWNDHFIPAGMEWPLHSCRNGMTTPFLQEWNEQSIPAGMECHSTPNLKKYASRTRLGFYDFWQVFSLCTLFHLRIPSLAAITQDGSFIAS